MSDNIDINSQNSITHAVDHYTHILYHLIIDSLYRMYKGIYTDTENNGSKNVMYDFQQQLRGIKDWNKSQIDGVVNSFLSDIDWTKEDFDHLITALFVGYSQMLTSVNLKTVSEEFVLRIPSYETFIHTIMVISAERIFRNPMIFSRNSNETICACYNVVEGIIQRACKTAIYSLLPLKPILSYSNKESKTPKSSDSRGGRDDDSENSDFEHPDSDDDDSPGGVNSNEDETKHIALGDGITPSTGEGDPIMDSSDPQEGNGHDDDDDDGDGDVQSSPLMDNDQTTVRPTHESTTIPQKSQSEGIQ